MLLWPTAVADPENFGGGGFEAQNLKNSDVFTKIESDFSAKIVTFRLVGGDASPPSPPLNPPLAHRLKAIAVGHK